MKNVKQKDVLPQSDNDNRRKWLTIKLPKQSTRKDENMKQARITLAKLLDTLSACQASQNSTEYDEHCRTLDALEAAYSRQCAEDERSAAETDFTNNNKKHTKGNPKK